MRHISWKTKTVRIEVFILLVCTALLLGALSLFLAFSEGTRSISDRIDKTKYQAVFLNIGGVGQQIAYFGKITSINDKYLILQDVYSITQQQAQDNQATATPQLVKFGCQQLHAPYDMLVINQNQVAYWENIRDDGKVVKAIKDFQKANPNGPNCSVQSTSTPQTQPSTPIDNNASGQ